MRRVGIFKSSILINIVNYVGLPLLAVYCISMFVYPWIVGRGSWAHVQAVWDRWQGLNTGALAFVASLVAFNITRFNENRQRERDFIAAKAFLPSTLSGLMEYCARCARIIGAMWDADAHDLPAIDRPEPPSDYREVFSNCVRHADPEVGAYLSNILVRLQVHDARLRDAMAETTGGRVRGCDKHSLIVYAFRLGELYALIGNLFGFARGEESFKPKNLSWEDFRNAYSILGLETDELQIDEDMNLQAFTLRRLERANASKSENEG